MNFCLFNFGNNTWTGIAENFNIYGIETSKKIATSKQLDEKINCRIDTPKSPSYPSVYLATMATAIEILAYYFPKERKNLLMIQQQLGESRLYGGIHFRKDLYDGVKLGKQIGKEIILQVSKELDVKGRVIDKF